MLETLLPNLEPASLVAKVVLLVIVTAAALIVQRISVPISRRALEAAKVPQATILLNIQRGFTILLNIQRGFIWGFALLFVLGPVFGVEPTGFIATLGVTSVALSMGLQDTVSNLIGGLTLMLTKIIKPGDYVTASGFTGKVTDINWRYTCLEDRGGNMQVIPNSVLWKSPFVKLVEGPALSTTLTLAVKHDADLNAVAEEAVVAATMAAAKLLDLTRKPVAQFSDPNAGSVTLNLTLFMADGTTSAAVNDVVARALVGKPWLA